MGFLDKAKAAADQLAAKADTALAGSGLGGPGTTGANADADRYFRDLGVLAYLEANGREASAQDRERILDTLRGMESQGAIRSFALQTAPPPAPGTASAPPAPGTASAPPPSSATPTPPPPAAPTPPSAPPPPPSWMKKDE